MAIQRLLLSLEAQLAFFLSFPPFYYFVTTSCFLAVVDIWCVALLLKYCESVARLSGLSVLVATLLPLTLIVTGLAVLNLELVAFEVLLGQGDRSELANDGANGTILLGTYFRVLASSFLLSQYAWLII